ncbi:MAG: hypothetical protein PVG23_04695 [Nitrosopumilaceae archaeon]
MKSKFKYHKMINFNVFACTVCGLKFDEETRLKIHFKTHEKREAKPKKQKRNEMPDFEKPDFSQVM